MPHIISRQTSHRADYHRCCFVVLSIRFSHLLSLTRSEVPFGFLSRQLSLLNWKCFVQKTVVCDSVNTQHVFEATTSHGGDYATVAQNVQE